VRLRRHAAPLVLSLTAVLLTGCGQGDREAGPTRTPAALTTPEATVTAPVVPPGSAVTDAATPTTSPGETDAAGLVVPAETAGDLDSRSVPQAPDLGRGWQRYVDPGDVAEGYTGNGSWVRARGAGEVVQAIVPLGCVGLTAPPTLPVPEHALEATYRGPAEAPGVALALDFADKRLASAFLTGVAQIARACTRPSAAVGPGDPLTVVVEPVRLAATTVLDRRREYGVGASEWLWSEVVVQQGARVGLLILASPRSAHEPDLVRLSKRLRATLPR